MDIVAALTNRASIAPHAQASWRANKQTWSEPTQSVRGPDESNLPEFVLNAANFSDWNSVYQAETGLAESPSLTSFPAYQIESIAQL